MEARTAVRAWDVGRGVGAEVEGWAGGEVGATGVRGVKGGWAWEGGIPAPVREVCEVCEGGGKEGAAVRRARVVVAVVVVVEAPEVDDPVVVLMVDGAPPDGGNGTCCPVYACACTFGTGTTSPSVLENVEGTEETTVGAVNLFPAAEADDPAKNGKENADEARPVLVVVVEPVVEPVVDAAVPGTDPGPGPGPGPGPARLCSASP